MPSRVNTNEERRLPESEEGTLIKKAAGNLPGEPAPVRQNKNAPAVLTKIKHRDYLVTGEIFSLVI